jgi:hypothetical protein
MAKYFKNFFRTIFPAITGLPSIPVIDPSILPRMEGWQNVSENHKDHDALMIGEKS